MIQTPPPQRRAWVLAYGQHIVHPQTKLLDSCLELEPPWKNPGSGPVTLNPEADGIII
jgi:hypothetical protein